MSSFAELREVLDAVGVLRYVAGSWRGARSPWVAARALRLRLAAAVEELEIALGVHVPGKVYRLSSDADRVAAARRALDVVRSRSVRSVRAAVALARVAAVLDEMSAG
jgi:hypothetical protein